MIAIIPARGGSKGLPGKNTRLLNGKPLIIYTIEAALDADGIDKVIVSTDSKKIAETATMYGADVPFLRPDYLANDSSSAVDVYIHAAEFLNSNYGYDISNFMVLLPTAPLRNSNHINEALHLFSNSEAKTLISVTEAEVPPSWYMQIGGDGFISNAGFDVNDSIVKNRQENKRYYIPNGAIYILDYWLLKNARTYYCDKTIPYIMKRTESVDIDTIDDFRYAEYLMSKEKLSVSIDNIITKNE